MRKFNFILLCKAQIIQYLILQQLKNILHNPTNMSKIHVKHIVTNEIHNTFLIHQIYTHVYKNYPDQYKRQAICYDIRKILTWLND